jgi:hypothetical protein
LIGAKQNGEPAERHICEYARQDSGNEPHPPIVELMACEHPEKRRAKHATFETDIDHPTNLQHGLPDRGQRDRSRKLD